MLRHYLSEACKLHYDERYQARYRGLDNYVAQTFQIHESKCSQAYTHCHTRCDRSR